MALTVYGYLDPPPGEGYLTDPYLGETGVDAQGCQVTMVINPVRTLRSQAKMVVTKAAAVGSQVLAQVSRSSSRGSQVLAVNAVSYAGKSQANMVADGAAAAASQVKAVASSRSTGRSQVNMVADGEKHTGVQVNRITSGLKLFGMSVRDDPIKHRMVDARWLADTYLTGSYIPAGMVAVPGMQVKLKNEISDLTGSQVKLVLARAVPTRSQARMIVNRQRALGAQVRMVRTIAPHTGVQIRAVVMKGWRTGAQVRGIISRSRTLGMQIQPITSVRTGAQATMVIYNTTELRIMTEFPSRGTADLLGDNWSASSVATGDFYPANLNTDVIEEVYRSQAGTAGLVTLVCDTGLPQGVPIDTIAILGHNLTRSAQVQVQGSQDNFATPPRITFNMTVELLRMFWISPEFPTQAGQNRYWKFIIQDITNPAGYIEIGTILFGVSDIFTTAESFVNPINKGRRHFKDTIKTEGFGSVSNDRALKDYLSLSFRDLNTYKGNFRTLDDMMRYARTSLKVLVIPVPSKPSRFAVFGKLTELPDFPTKYIDDETEYVDIDLTWDESE